MQKPTKTELTKYRALLERQLASLRGDVGSMRDEALRASDQEASVDNLADQGTDNYDQGFMLGLIENEEETIQHIEEALDRIDGKGDWDFGVCPNCLEEAEGSKKKEAAKKKVEAQKAVAIKKAAEAAKKKAKREAELAKKKLAAEKKKQQIIAQKEKLLAAKEKAKEKARIEAERVAAKAALEVERIAAREAKEAARLLALAEKEAAREAALRAKRKPEPPPRPPIIKTEFVDGLQGTKEFDIKFLTIAQFCSLVYNIGDVVSTDLHIRRIDFNAILEVILTLV